MSARYFAGIEPDRPPRLDLASLIDMSFLMLIFFMVAATLQKQEADLPVRLSKDGSATATMAPVRMERMRVTIDDRGTVSVNGQAIATPGHRRDMTVLADRLARYASVASLSGSEPQVQIDCDGAAAEQRFIDVLNACRRAGVQQISLVEQ